MSVMSSLRRKVYGVPPRHEREFKFRFFRKVNAERGLIHQRAQAGLLKRLEAKEAQQARRREVTQ